MTSDPTPTKDEPTDLDADLATVRGFVEDSHEDSCPYPAETDTCACLCGVLRTLAALDRLEERARRAEELVASETEERLAHEYLDEVLTPLFEGHDMRLTPEGGKWALRQRIRFLWDRCILYRSASSAAEERARRAERAEHAAREVLQHSDNELHAIIAERTEYLSQRDAAYDVLRPLLASAQEAQAALDGVVPDAAFSDRFTAAIDAARTFLDSITKGEPDAPPPETED